MNHCNKFQEINAVMKLVIFFFMLEVIRIGLKIHYCPLALSVNAYDEER